MEFTKEDIWLKIEPGYWPQAKVLSRKVIIRHMENPPVVESTDSTIPKPIGRRPLIACIVVIGLAFLIFPLVYQNIPNPDDVDLYYLYGQYTLDGKLPYRDFSIEYPPFVLPFFIAPAIVSNIFGPPTQERYVIFFQLEMYLLLIATLIVVVRFGQKLYPQLSLLVGVRYFTVAAVVFTFFISRRFDIVAALLVTLVFYLFYLKRQIWGGFVLGLATLTKLFPAIILPIALMYYWKIRKQLFPAEKIILGFIVSAFIITVPFLLFAQAGLKGFLTYHSERGIQIESVYGIVIWLGSVAGLTTASSTSDHNSINLASSWGAPLSAVALPLTVLGLLAFYAYIWFKTREDKNLSLTWLIQASVIATLWFILSNKVLSPQYLIWLLPFLTFWRGARVWLYIGACALSFIIFPVMGAAMVRVEWYAMLTITVRYLLVVGIFGLEIRDFLQRDSPSNIQTNPIKN